MVLVTAIGSRAVSGQPDETVGSLLEAQAAARGDEVLVRCGEQQHSFAGMLRRAEQIAAGLAALGVGVGDRIAVLAGTRMEVIELFYGAALRGAVQVPVNVYLKGEFLLYQLTDTDPTVLVVDAEGLEATADLLDDLPGLQAVICLDERTHDLGTSVHDWATLLVDQPPPEPDLGPASLHSIMYTSGTTGMPKGCELSHAYHTHAARASGAMVDYSRDDVALTPLPLYHQWARGTLVGGLAHGMQVVVEPEFSAGAWLDRVRETGATIFQGVGAMGQAVLATEPSDEDRDHDLRLAFMLPFGPDDEARWVQRFGGSVFSQMYGQTETGAITYTPADQQATPGAIGTPSPHFEVTLLDDEGYEVDAGEVGELAVRPTVPHSIYDGYWNRPEATVEAWRGLWHHTGDLARADEDGLLWFVDRRSDALRRRGENVSSLQLEHAIMACDGVAAAAVHAVPGELGEDDIKACVVADDGAELTPEGLFGCFADRLPYFAVPRYVEVLDALPRNATMRVMKYRLRDRGVNDETWDLQELGLTVERAERR